MRYTIVPGTALQVAQICLGTSELGAGIDRETSFALLDAYSEAGGNLIDTASVYANWSGAERSVSEKTIGAWLDARRTHGRVLVATKGGHPELSSMSVSRLSREELRSDLHASLRNLRTDCIDLYWVHRDDRSLPVGEILGTLGEMVSEGKVRYVGCSNWRAERIREAQACAGQEGWLGFVADQMRWSAAVLDPSARGDLTTQWMDPDLKRSHRESGMAAFAYSSQAGGLFQKMAEGRLAARRPGVPEIYPREANVRQFQRIREVAGRTGLSISQVVLGYLQSQPFPTIPIVGCRNLSQLRDSLRAADTALTAEDVAFLEAGV